MFLIPPTDPTVFYCTLSSLLTLFCLLFLGLLVSCGLITYRDAGKSVVNIDIRALALGYDVDQALFNATATDGAAASAAAAYAADAGGDIDE